MNKHERTGRALLVPEPAERLPAMLDPESLVASSAPRDPALSPPAAGDSIVYWEGADPETGTPRAIQVRVIGIPERPLSLEEWPGGVMADGMRDSVGKSLDWQTVLKHRVEKQ